jgi:hypothetical protein
MKGGADFSVLVIPVFNSSTGVYYFKLSADQGKAEEWVWNYGGRSCNCSFSSMIPNSPGNLPHRSRH